MTDVNSVLKNAFIDSQLDCDTESTHNFSPIFEKEMRKLIKSQKSMLKLINTAGKKVAVVLLSILIISTSTVFSVKALREPVIEAIQSFFVNVKEQLSGTRADNIAVHFSEDITQIVATNNVTSAPKEYIIDGEEKIAAFTELLATTNWGTPRSELEADTEYVIYKFEFKTGNETVTTLNICSYFPGLFGIAEIIYDGQSTVYNISERTYFDILAFTTQKYYLHKSDLEQPKKEQCLEWQKNALVGLNESEKKEFCEAFKWLHIQIEEFLLGNVSLLKEPDSIYWKRHELKRDEVFKDPISGTESIDNAYHIMLGYFETLISLAKDTEIRNALTVMKSDYINAFKFHDIGSLFSVHEVIHDYDYYVVNYPISFSTAPPDWGGLDDYFGRLED